MTPEKLIHRLIHERAIRRYLEELHGLDPAQEIPRGLRGYYEQQARAEIERDVLRQRCIREATEKHP